MSERRRKIPAGPWREQHRVVGRCTATSSQGAGGSSPAIQAGFPVGLAFQVGVHRGLPPDATAGRRTTPCASQASFQAVVELAGGGPAQDAGGGERSPIVIAADEIPLPAEGWELRTSGLWADHNCETPFEHWSYGLEAFALGVDDRRELLERGYGDRTPLGWELDFEADSAVSPIDEEIMNVAGYAQTGVLHGLVLLADGEVEVSGAATRWRWWGSDRPNGLLFGSRTERAVALPTPDGVWWIAPLEAGTRP